MKNLTYPLLFFVVFLFTLSNANSEIPPNTYEELEDCSGQSSWVDTPTLPLDPTESLGHGDICKFMQFAWQSFAYYTEEKSEEHFLNMMPKERVFKRYPDHWDNKGDRGMVMNETLQAGSNLPLYDKQLNPVYYQQSINSIFYKDIVENQLNNQQCVVEIDQGIVPFDITPGSTEIKTSWKLLTDDDPSSFFTIRRDINMNGSVISQALLGLVGIHIVRKTPDHPEWIWTTFEHKNNAPNCDSVPRILRLEEAGDWTFFDSMSHQKVNTYIPGKPTQVCRETPYGAGFLVGPSVIKTIKSINHDMTLHYKVRASIWENYFLVGASWTRSPQSQATKGVIPPTGSNENVGSNLLSNSTLETYVQNPKWFDLKYPEAHKGCFTCHHYNPSKKNALHLSHMFNAARDYGKCGAPQNSDISR